MPSAVSSPSVYEFSCSCGHAITVTAGQAGSQVHCVCGNLVDVPTIRELRRNAAPQSAAAHALPTKVDPRAAQDEFSRIILTVVAIGLILVGLAISGSLYRFQSAVPDQEIDPRYLALIKNQNEKMDQIPPAPLWDEWAYARDNGLGEHNPWTPVINKERAQSALYGIYFGLGAAGLGVLLLVLAMILPRRAAVRT